MQTTNTREDIKKISQKNTDTLVGKLSGLVDKMKAGDQDAFEEFYEAAKDYVYSNIKMVSSSLDEGTVEDIMQDVFIKAFSGVDKLKESNGVVKWLKVITINTTKDYFKKSSVMHETLIKETEEETDFFESAKGEDSLYDEIPIPENVVEDKAARKIVRDTINTLPEDQKLIFLEFYYNETPVKEIASMFGMSEGAVKTKLSRTRKSMKEKFQTIEKEQGIRLHSVGIAPLIAFLIYISMQEEKISESTSAAVKAAVFASDTVRKAAGGAAVVKASAAGTAKAASLSAAAKGAIIGAAALAAAAGGFAIYKGTSSNNEAETVIVETTTARETTTQEETTTAAIDERALMYQYYYDRLLEFTEVYGEQSFEGIIESDTVYASQSGLCVAKLIDFDKDGMEELYLCHSDAENESGYTVEVWAYKDESIEQVYSGGASVYTDDVSCCIVEAGETYYVEVYDIAENGADSYEYQGYASGEFYIAASFEDIDSDSGYEQYNAWTDTITETIYFSLSVTSEDTGADLTDLEDEQCAASVAEVLETIESYLSENQ